MIVLTNRVTGKSIRVNDDEQAAYWAERGYAAQDPAPKKAAPRRAAKKK